MSRELIHHYLRQGLIPRPPARARYDDRQIRLLLLIKKLRDDHNLPLEVIRGIFEIFDFDPGRIEPLVLAESLSHRLSLMVDGDSLALGRTFTADELATASGTNLERLNAYIKQRLVSPLEEGDRPRFTAYDANVIALCERGVALGIRFEAFRTIASYVRVAFDLEHAEFFDLGDPGSRGLRENLSELFLRRELVAAFVQNVYQTQVQGHLRTVLEQPAPLKTSLDAVVYRPSAAFAERHGIDGRSEELDAQVGREPDDPAHWLRAAQLQVHAGRYREAAFFLEQALERWPDDATLRTHYGMALVLSGEDQRGRDQLEAVAAEGSATVLTTIYLALSLFNDASRKAGDQGGGGDWPRVRALAEQALDAAHEPLARMFGAWLLTALPRAFRSHDRGIAILRETLDELAANPASSAHLPGLQQRYLINASYLLFECLQRQDDEPPESLEQLRLLVCRHDPGCAFARDVYLADSADNSDQQGGRR